MFNCLGGTPHCAFSVINRKYIKQISGNDVNKSKFYSERN